MAYGVTQQTTSSRRSMLFSYHKPSPNTRKCNFIYTRKTEVCITPVITIHMSDKNNYIQMSNIEL
jgi:hypothetical protein